MPAEPQRWAEIAVDATGDAQEIVGALLLNTARCQGYATTKAAMIEMTRSLRLEYRDEPVSFSSVNPGFVSDAGMYARMEAAGDKAPLALGTSKPGRVASAVVDVIEHDRAERNVATRPMRPLFALTELLPAIGDAGVRAAGGRRFLRSVGRTRGRV